MRRATRCRDARLVSIRRASVVKRKLQHRGFNGDGRSDRASLQRVTRIIVTRIALIQRTTNIAHNLRLLSTFVAMRALYHIVLLLCLLLQGSVLALHSQTTDTTAVATPHRVALTGYVLDRDREPIEFASVRVEGTTIGTWSDLTGAYRLELTPTTDSVVVTYSSIGYQTVRQVYPQGISRDIHFNPMPLT